MEIGGVRFAGVECHDDALMFEVDFYVTDSINFHERSAELSYAFVAIFAFGCDLDRFQDRVIGSLGIKRVARVGIVWSCRVHSLSLSNVRGWLCGRLSRNRLQHTPDVFGLSS